MGIINITPDSFYPSSRVTGDKDIIGRAAAMLREGAAILDIGGFSTRPGAVMIPKNKERRRVIHAVTIIKKEFPDAIISVDTFRADIAKEAADNGANIINDISGGADNEMFKTVIDLKIPYILTHNTSIIADKDCNHAKNNCPNDSDLIQMMLNWFDERTAIFKASGHNGIIIDPGIGFGKTIKQNFEIIAKLKNFRIGYPLLTGVSRKTMIWKTLKCTVEEALNGTTVINTIALMNGTDILRVHDIKEASEAVKLTQMIKSTN